MSFECFAMNIHSPYEHINRLCYICAYTFSTVVCFVSMQLCAPYIFQVIYVNNGLLHANRRDRDEKRREISEEKVVSST